MAEALATKAPPVIPECPAIFADGLASLAVHNGVVRLTFLRLDSVGKANPCLELMLPNSALTQTLKALQAVRA